MPKPDNFHDALVGMLPRLRMQAVALTRNRAAAEDLAQDTAANALAGYGSFTPGTNFGAWTHRILYNQFISTYRKRRETVQIDGLPEAAIAVGGAQEHRLLLDELRRAILSLPPKQRTTLLLVALQGMSYDEVAAVTACPVGTAKTRVSLARRHLQASLTGISGGRAATSGVAAAVTTIERGHEQVTRRTSVARGRRTSAA